MIAPEMVREARLIVSRNLTGNVAGAKVSFVKSKGHLHLIYYLFDVSTEYDEEERELSMTELIAAFPEIRTATSAFASHEEMEAQDRLTLPQS
jgi:hypothetical protein